MLPGMSSAAMLWKAGSIVGVFSSIGSMKLDNMLLAIGA